MIVYAAKCGFCGYTYDVTHNEGVYPRNPSGIIESAEVEDDIITKLPDMDIFSLYSRLVTYKPCPKCGEKAENLVLNISTYYRVLSKGSDMF